MTQEEIEIIAKDFYPLENQLMERIAFKRGFTESLEMQKIAKETHLFSEKDMIDFATFRNGGDVREEFELWESQQPKKVLL